ncbi:DUF4126 domain-containing protein [Propionibacteriaceae bacterium Y2011]|uniref:DUF4126 domain-containing protein n=1 Tax=Microlunatus sp. Y2014 TaxID=3418488 RepID=UPI003B48CEBA
MEVLPLAFTSGWASGINAYATTLILGLLGRFAGFSQIPEGLQRTDVLIVMAVLTVLEVVADKIPYLDSIWDTVSTIIRPVIGAVIGALLAGANGDLWTITLAAVGGVTALLSHLTKAGLRLAINTSPEPATNIGASVFGDVSVVGATVGVVLFPIPVAIITAVVLVIGLVVLVRSAGRVRKGWRGFRDWQRRRRAGSTSAEGRDETDG